MAIKTSTFGGVTLTGKSADAFRKQFLESKPTKNIAAQKALKKGMQAVKEFQENGFVIVKPKRK